MAVINLQAMINIDDMDRIFNLLEENDWDEGKAASAFFAKQMAATGVRPEQEEELKDDVRAPI